MGKCIFLRKGSIHEAPVVPFDPVFANNTWNTIIKVCKAKAVPDTWAVGDSKMMTINGADYPITIIGKNHDTYSDGGGTAPLTLETHDCYLETKNMNSTWTNVGGWTECLMRTTHLPGILKLMPEEVQVNIKEVTKKTGAGNNSSTITETSDKLFLLSETELFGNVINAASGEGNQYEYYAAGNSRIKQRSGETVQWWERSPHATANNAFCRVHINGNQSSAAAGNALSFPFAFCF